MKLLIRIALAIAIVACISALIFTSQLSEQRKGLRTDIANLTTQKNKLTKDLADTRTDLATTKQDLTKTKDELTTTKGELEAGKIALAAKTQEADKLQASLNTKTTELDQAKADRDTAQLAMKKIQDSLEKVGIKDISNIDSLRDKVISQTEENQILGKQLLAARTDNTALKEKIVFLTTTPSNLRGRVAAVQDNWGFMILSVGREQRVQPNTEFIVYRSDKMVAKVQVRTVGETTSVAESIPAFQLAQPRVGDIIVH